MSAKRKPQPKLYQIKTFQMRSYDESKGFVREYTVAANTRAQAVRVAGLDKGEAILRISCIGNRRTAVTYWQKTP